MAVFEQFKSIFHSTVKKTSQPIRFVTLDTCPGMLLLHKITNLLLTNSQNTSIFSCHTMTMMRANADLQNHAVYIRMNVQMIKDCAASEERGEEG